ncbi:type II toxin-antitoxin system VapC family toxin [Candidatus Woesearchaeota archaeon]|nr:type II toxin-antitoxin system VapC family toxin [Candidatus Woesearchaeota archaeon]
MKVLDTTFLIDLLNGDKRTLKITEDNEQLLTTQINMYEVIRGAFLGDASKPEILKAKELFGDIIVLQLDDNSVIKAAEIFTDLTKQGNIIADNDCLIAAIALSNGIGSIVTKNTEHFKRIKGIKVETY